MPISQVSRLLVRTIAVIRIGAATGTHPTQRTNNTVVPIR